MGGICCCCGRWVVRWLQGEKEMLQPWGNGLDRTGSAPTLRRAACGLVNFGHPVPVPAGPAPRTPDASLTDFTFFSPFFSFLSLRPSVLREPPTGLARSGDCNGAAASAWSHRAGARLPGCTGVCEGWHPARARQTNLSRAAPLAGPDGQEAEAGPAGVEHGLRGCGPRPRGSRGGLPKKPGQVVPSV